jgi:hypothetical protein
MVFRSSIQVAMVAGWLMVAAHADAQMFGSRTLGQTLSRRPSPAAAAVGTLTGGERFVRSNRRRTDFVGSDALELARFVGRIRGLTRGAAQSSMTGFRVEQAPDANRTAPPAALRRAPVYAPRLELAESFSGPAPETVRRRLENQLARSPGLALYGPVEVWVEGGTAILRGEAASARDAEMAALVVAMEPGVERVQNELIIRSSIPPPAPAPEVRRSRSAR